MALPGFMWSETKVNCRYFCSHRPLDVVIGKWSCLRYVVPDFYPLQTRSFMVCCTPPTVSGSHSRHSMYVCYMKKVKKPDNSVAQECPRNWGFAGTHLGTGSPSQTNKTPAYLPCWKHFYWPRYLLGLPQVVNN